MIIAAFLCIHHWTNDNRPSHDKQFSTRGYQPQQERERARTELRLVGIGCRKRAQIAMQKVILKNVLTLIEVYIELGLIYRLG